MNKTDLVAAIAERAEMKKTDVDAALKGMMEVVMENMTSGDGDVTIPGFVAFKRTQRAARQGRDMRTGQPIEVPATTTCSIKAGSKLKAAAKANAPAKKPAKKKAAKK